MGNLLEKIIKERSAGESDNLDATKIVNSLFSELLDREKDILSRRKSIQTTTQSVTMNMENAEEKASEIFGPHLRALSGVVPYKRFVGGHHAACLRG